ncbi:MAG: alpha/beta hydrolase [Chloroflexi bacterium]|nr:alpha/beta hydrolase [Chloroflexota bacterium]
MLNWMIVHLARAYLVMVILAQIGALQIVAARRGWLGLSIVNYRRRPVVGYILGAAMILGAYIWFFASHPEIWTPGPAGAELTTLFTVGSAISLLATLLLAEGRRLLVGLLRRRRGLRSGDAQLAAIPFHLKRASRDAESLSTVTFGDFSGALLAPERSEEPRPAVVLVPGLYATGEAVQWVVEGLQDLGFWVLVAHLRRRDLTYPEVLAVLPTAVSFLAGRPQVDPQRIGAVGFGIGANIVLRSASTDPRVKALAAIGPLVSQESVAPGLNLLHEMTYLQVLRWATFRARGELVAQLAALEYARKLKNTPALLIWGERDRLVSQADLSAVQAAAERGIEVRRIEGETHFGLYRGRAAVALTTKWFRERLLNGG